MGPLLAGTCQSWVGLGGGLGGGGGGGGFKGLASKKKTFFEKKFPQKMWPLKKIFFCSFPYSLRITFASVCIDIANALRSSSSSSLKGFLLKC